ncbi:hypothetical protein ACFV2H_14105 [Streptomyces sp. NPDC059629]|uniref:hypothetical protein n=1 Tax=Streptomyces sp. NPDC059629 TaxID=3346889 RepID=UPI0036C32622
MPASAMLTAIAFGLVYGASLTPVGWRNTFVMGFVGMVLGGGLIGLAFVLYDFRTENPEESVHVQEIAVAICVAVTMFVGWIVLKDHALHERGRPVRAVVTALQASARPFDAGTEAVLADASHHPLGAIGAGDLAVGDHITVTIDPRGRYGVSAGPPPRRSRMALDAVRPDRRGAGPAHRLNRFQCGQGTGALTASGQVSRLG